MKQNCTIFCTIGTAEKFLKIANDISGRRITKEGDKHNWSSLVYEQEETKMTINRMDKTAADNAFIKIIEATQSFVKGIKTSVRTNQDELINTLSTSGQLLAITVEPVFDEISEDIVYSILQASEGVLFTGNDFLNEEGGLILNLDGNSDSV